MSTTDKNCGLIISSINSILKTTQNAFKYLWENSYFAQNIDNLIFATIIAVFILSTFASSSLLGTIALMTLGLTVIKTLIKPNEKLEMNLFEKFLLIYFLFVIVSLAGSTLFHLSLKGFTKTFTYIGFYFSLVQYYKNNLNKIPLTMEIIAILATIQGLIGFAQNFACVGEISTWQDVTRINEEEVMTRVYGTLQPFNPNLFGGYLVVTLPCIIGAMFTALNHKNIQKLILYFVSLGITTIALLLSGCRGAYIGLLAIAICSLGFIAKFIWDNNFEKLKKLYVSFIGTLAAIACSAAVLITPLRARIISIFAMRSDSSTSFRFNVYQAAIQMAKDNWLLGIGVGNQNFREIYGLYMRTGFDALSCYCIYLETIVESGIFALVAFLGFLGFLIAKAFKFALHTKDIQKLIITACSATAVIAVMVHGMVDTVFFRPQIQFVFWAIVSFISAELNPQNCDCD